MSPRPPARPPSLAQVALGLAFAAFLALFAASPWLSGGEIPVFAGAIFLPLALMVGVGSMIGLVAGLLGLPLDDEAQLAATEQDPDEVRALGRLSPGRRALSAGSFLVGAAVILHDVLRPGRVPSTLGNGDLVFGLAFGGVYLAVAALFLLPGPQRRALFDALERLQERGGR